MCDLLLFSGFFCVHSSAIQFDFDAIPVVHFIRTYACIFIQYGIDCFNINGNIAKNLPFNLKFVEIKRYAPIVLCSENLKIDKTKR